MPALPEISPSTMYLVLNLGILPFWALLILMPRAQITDTLVHSVMMPLILGVTYAWLLATALALPAPEGAGFSSLEGLMKLFTVEMALVAAWSHYIVFDLFVGAWEARDAQRVGMNHLLLVPCLVLTLLVGPIGLLAYIMIRGLTGKSGFSLFEG
jgi:hypothetical protein